MDPSVRGKAGELLERLGELKIKAFGGYDDAERVMFAMFPDYMDEDEIIFPIDAVRISYNSKFSSSLSHRDFLGSIIGLGIERIKVGDILVYDGEALCFSDSSISQYIVSNLERVGHTKVTAQIAALELLNIPEKKIETKNVTVSSLRADTVFGAVFGKSRSEAQEAIRAERASVNWRPLKSVSEPINDGDVLSVKGWGRGTLVQTGGTTKKGRIVITVGRYV